MTRKIRLKDVLIDIWIDESSFLNDPEILIPIKVRELDLDEIDKAEIKREISLMLIIDDAQSLRLRWASLNPGIDADGNTIRRMLSAVKNAI